MDPWLGSINPQLHSLRTFSSNQGLIGLHEMACVFKGRINPQSHCPGNLKGVAAVYKQAKLYSSKCRSQGRTFYSLRLLLTFAGALRQKKRTRVSLDKTPTNSIS